MKKILAAFLLCASFQISAWAVPEQGTRIVNVSYSKGASFINCIEGKNVGGIRVKIEKDGVPLKNAKVLFRPVLEPKGCQVTFNKETVLTDHNGQAEVTALGIRKKGDYIISASLPEDPYAAPVSISIRAYSSGWMILVIIGLFGGLGMFLFGMKLGADGLQNIAGQKMKDILSTLTTKPVMGLLVGILATAAVQSSSATSSMCVGFVSATLMTLGQSLSVMLGARIGTTVTAQLIAFKLSDYALLLVLLGFILLVASKKKKIQHLGGILIGFGFIFFGMGVMSDAMLPLRSNPGFTSLLLSLSSRPLLALLFSAIFTAIIQSSGATVGLAMVFADQGLISLNGANPIALGAMIGTTITGILASLGANRDGKRVAVSNLIFALLACLACFPFLKFFNILTVKLTRMLGTDDLPRQVANAYTLLSLWGSVIYLPFLRPLEKLILKIIPPDPESMKKFTPLYLQEGFESSPDVALDMSKKELLRMGGIVADMIEKIPGIYRQRDEDLIQALMREDDKVDILDEAIIPYLNKIARSGLSEKQTSHYMAQLYITNYLETLGDIIVKNIMHQAGKLITEEFSFNEKELTQLADLASKVHELLKTDLEAFEKRSHEKAEQVTQLHLKLGRIGKKIQQDHFTAMQQDADKPVSQSSVFLDTIGGVMNLADQINSIAKTILEEL